MSPTAMVPGLVTIPSELQGLITGYLCTFDQNCLSRTCKTLNAVVLAKLYNRVTLKIPIRWWSLAHLENLLGSAGDGLKYTTEICITVKQQASKDDSYENDSNEAGYNQAFDETADESLPLFQLPNA